MGLISMSGRVIIHMKKAEGRELGRRAGCSSPATGRQDALVLRSRAPDPPAPSGRPHRRVSGNDQWLWRCQVGQEERLFVLFHVHTWHPVHRHSLYTHAYTCMHAHIHTCTCMWAHVLIHVHTRAYTHMFAHTDTHTYMLAYPHTHAYRHMHAHILSYTCTHTHTHICTHMHIYTYAHTLTHMHIHTCVYNPSTHMQTHACTYSCTHACTLFVIHTLTHTHTCIHSLHVHSCLYKHSYSHAHTDTQPDPGPPLHNCLKVPTDISCSLGAQTSGERFKGIQYCDRPIICLRRLMWVLHNTSSGCLCACSVVYNSLQPHGLLPTRLLCPGDFPGKNTRVGCCFLLQGIFPSEIEPTSPALQADSLPLNHQGRLSSDWIVGKLKVNLPGGWRWIRWFPEGASSCPIIEVYTFFEIKVE